MMSRKMIVEVEAFCVVHFEIYKWKVKQQKRWFDTEIGFDMS